MEKPIHCYKNESSSGEKNILNCSVPLLDGCGPCCYCGGGRLQNFISPFFFPSWHKDWNSPVSFFCHLFFLIEWEKIRTLSPFYSCCFLSFEYCIAFFRIISFPLNGSLNGSLIITAQQDFSASGPGARDLHALFISKAVNIFTTRKGFQLFFPPFLFI